MIPLSLPLYLHLISLGDIPVTSPSDISVTSLVTQKAPSKGPVGPFHLWRSNRPPTTRPAPLTGGGCGCLPAAGRWAFGRFLLRECQARLGREESRMRTDRR